MTVTAYLHPDFPEELALLPPDLRISFYAQLLRRNSSALDLDFLSQYIPQSALPRTLCTRFVTIATAPKLYAAYNTSLIDDAIVYLCVLKDSGDDVLVETSFSRVSTLASEEAQPIPLDDFLLHHVDQDEYEAAQKENTERFLLNQQLEFLQGCFHDAKKDLADLVNCSGPQLERLIVRIDFFLDIFNQKLASRGGQFSLNVGFKSGHHFEAKSFKNMQKIRRE